MYYFALLISPERDLTPEEGAEEMAAYQNFHAKAAGAMRAGDALQSQSTGVRISGGPDAPIVTDGPFIEAVEQMVGFYLIDSGDEADLLEIVRSFAEGGDHVEFRRLATG